MYVHFYRKNYKIDNKYSCRLLFHNCINIWTNFLSFQTGHFGQKCFRVDSIVIVFCHQQTFAGFYPGIHWRGHQDNIKQHFIIIMKKFSFVHKKRKTNHRCTRSRKLHKQSVFLFEQVMNPSIHSNRQVCVSMNIYKRKRDARRVFSSFFSVNKHISIHRNKIRERSFPNYVFLSDLAWVISLPVNDSRLNIGFVLQTKVMKDA